MGCFYCDEHHEGREAIMYKVGEMEAGVLYLFKDQAHKGRCALALKNHRKELCECGPEELVQKVFPARNNRQPQFHLL